MPKKKGKKKTTNAGKDFTINDCANAPKPVGRPKKSVNTDPVPEKSWDELQEDDFDIVEETNADGTKLFVYKKNRNHSKKETDIIARPGRVYPEIVWHLLSPYIKPENVGNFAGINRATYAITKRVSFWRALYKRYCQKSPKLPEKLRIENNYKLYGLQQRVIRALYHAYDIFNKKVTQTTQHGRPHDLVQRRCVNVWYCKGPAYWSIYFKFKKFRPDQVKHYDFIEELGRIDANPEEDSKVLEVMCKGFSDVPPLMGMMLSSVSVTSQATQGFRHHRLHLGFNSGYVNISHTVIPERSIVLDTINMLVYEWWHPKYPHFENKLPYGMLGEESLPVLKRDFFTSCEGDL